MQGIPEGSLSVERRKRVRARVHWPLYFSLPGTAEQVQTITQDLSSNGFYCVANAKFVPGEARECTLLVPTHHPNGGDPALPVLCKVRVIRVEVLAEAGFYGVGFQIEDYRFVNSEIRHEGLRGGRRTPDGNEPKSST
ncbi:MAG: PilZ domain-containing protein [Bryobacteraceae bacterium]|jgi:hypothetical protein